ncbi:uncharacterized protein LY79DRAFT_4245 [Colletotrichum navitas]|uniref:Uncharacterized protein n=1 Tax=Colletotrichum navitas TaxID=681940 RepID=A0AAD8QDJ5_9PEZI|nr:uncharacterized protein LY79DRAFT_4245 [Colletotrichum navitas]KAK1600026.1 hypothetical protein LY79DRAFT_4245 [Colletotrichum navitas]
MKKPYPAFFLPPTLPIYLMQQSPCKIVGRASVPTITYRSRRISVRPRPPFKPNKPTRATSLPSLHRRQAIPSLLFHRSLSPPLPPRPSGLVPKPRRVKPMRRASREDGKKTCSRTAGRWPTLSHVAHTHTHVLVRHNFCDVPLHPSAAPPVTVIPSSPSCEPSAPWTEPDAVTARGLGGPRGGRCTSYEAGPPPSLLHPLLSQSLASPISPRDCNVLPWKKLWARRYIVLPRNLVLSFAIFNRSPDAEGPDKSSGGGGGATTERAINLAKTSRETRTRTHTHTHTHTHVLTSRQPHP